MWIKLSSREVINPGTLLSISQSVNKLSISFDSVYGHQTPLYISSRYANDIYTELNSMRSHEHDNKLFHIYIMNLFSDIRGLSVNF